MHSATPLAVQVRLWRPSGRLGAGVVLGRRGCVEGGGSVQGV